MKKQQNTCISTKVSLSRIANLSTSFVIALLILSNEVMALNIRANPGNIPANTIFTINQDETLDQGSIFIPTGSTLENNGVSTTAKFTINGNLTNQGFIEWGTSSFDQINDGATVTNLQYATMEFGKFSNNGGHLFDMHGGTFINQGLVQVLGGRFHMDRDASIKNKKTGKMIVLFNQGCGGIPNFENNGYFEVGIYGTWCSGSAEFSHGGETVINGEFFSSGIHAYDDVKISGSGTIHSTDNIFFYDNYRLAPGSKSTGNIDILTINNPLSRPTFFIDGEIEIEIAGSDSQSYDKLNLTGPIGLYYGATLNIILRNGFTPQAGNLFDIINSSSVRGQFAKLILPELPNGLTWNVQYLNTGIQLLVQ